MPGLSLYPWQGAIDRWWANVQQADSLPHALLISGQQGSGKRHLADQLCQALYADNAQAQTLYRAGTHPDFFKLGLAEKKKEISVEQVRDLASRVMLTSQLQGWRIVWVDPADRLSRSAANALLKILEEPPQQVLFVLIVDETQRLLPTIRSRCQQLKLSLPSRAEALSWLSQQAAVAELTAEQLQDWLALCGGSPLRVLQALSEVDDSNASLLSQADARLGLLEQLVNNQIDVISCADQWLALSNDIDAHLQWLQGFALDLLKCAQDLNIDFYENRRASALLSRLAPYVAADDVVRYLLKMGHIRRGVRGNVNTDLSLQAALLPWLSRLQPESAEVDTPYSLAS